MAYFTNDKDRKVKVFNNGVAVSSSNAQSEYARYLNFKENFTITTNTISGDKVYDIVGKGYAIPQEGGVAQGTTNRPLNYKDSDFDIVEVTGSPGSYDISSTGRVNVNSISTIRPLNVVNTTNHTAVTVADNSGTDKIDLTFSNNDVDVLSEGTLVNTSPRRLNFSGFTVTDNSGSDRVDITGNFLPNVFGKKYGMMYGAQNLNDPDQFPAGDGLLNLNTVSLGSGNTVSGGYDTTDGVYRRYTTGGADNEGFRITSNTDITNRSSNPHIYGKFRINTLGNHRFFMGWHTGSIPINDDNFLNSLTGFGIGYQNDTGGGSPDTQWRILRNNGAGSVTKTNTGISLAAGTVFTFELLANNSTPNWQWNVNGGAFTAYNTLVPTTENLRFTFYLEEIGGSVTDFDVFYLYWVQNI